MKLRIGAALRAGVFVSRLKPRPTKPTPTPIRLRPYTGLRRDRHAKAGKPLREATTKRARPNGG